LSVVVPCYNEEANVANIYRRITAVIAELGVSAELLFVDDGSTDKTSLLLDGLQARDARVVLIHLSRNFGHQPAVTAGIDHARGEAVILLDGDLQDPPELIAQFVGLWREGSEVVYAVRRKRKEGLLKRLSYHHFYRLQRSISDLDMPLDSGDYCLMDRTVVEAMKALPERTRFVRGLRAFVGFRQTPVVYERAAREAGQSKYTFRKLLGLAVEGLVGFSSAPLRLVTFLGLGTGLLAFIAITAIVVEYFTHHTAPQGWSSTAVVVLLMGAIQLLSLGIMGEYVRRIFLEVTNRPTYIAREVRRTSERESQDAADRNEQPEPGGQPIR
jgi:dolichol-phosphate mannosyltransferase